MLVIECWILAISMTPGCMSIALAQRERDLHCRAVSRAASIGLVAIVTYRETDPATREEALSILGRAANDEDPVVRASAIRALRDCGPIARPALDSLISAMNSRSWETGADAIQAIGAMGKEGRGAIGPMIEIAVSPRAGWTATLAVEALGEIGAGDPQAVTALVRILRDESSPWRVRAVAAAAMHKVGAAPPDVAAGLALLAKGLTDPDASIRDFAVKKLGAVGLPAAGQVPALAVVVRKDPDYWTATDAMEAIEKIGVIDKGVLDALAEVARSPSDRSLQAVMVLNDIGPRAGPTAPVLVDVLRDKARNPTEREYAAIALGNLKDKTNVSVPALVESLRDHQFIIRCAAAESLGILGEKSALSDLRALTKDKEPIVRVTAARVIRRIEGGDGR